MEPDLRPIIDQISNQADDFLDGARDRAQGRAGIEELLTMDYNELDSARRKAVTDGVMAVLEAEGFFSATAGGSANPEADEFDD
ncbi:MAG: hypothetical protein ABIZ49_10605 [Opitutaceae bacterium]